MNQLMELRPQTASLHTLTPAPTNLLQRKCACGGTPGPTGECATCRAKRLGLQRSAPEAMTSPSVMSSRVAAHSFMGSRTGHNFGQIAVHDHHARTGKPAKALGAVSEERGERKPSPRQGAASIQCDGAGGYEITYGGWAGTGCGTKSCVTAHESSHMADWQAKWPSGCQGQPKGYLPKGDPPDNPLMTASEYSAFLKASECKAHTADLACAEALPKPAGCEATVDDYIKLTREQKANWCPSLSRGAKIALGAGGGALAGAGIGALAGGPIGAAIGAGIGALVGGIAGLFF
jgi:hypothetical protein